MSYRTPGQARFQYMDALEPNQLVVPGHQPTFIPVTYAANIAVGPGTLMGLVTAAGANQGALIPCVQTATDGSQAPYVVTPESVDTTAAGPSGAAQQLTGHAYAKGYFNYTAMTIDASWGATPDLQAAALIGPLRTLGIFIRGLVYSS